MRVHGLDVTQVREYKQVSTVQPCGPSSLIASLCLQPVHVPVARFTAKIFRLHVRKHSKKDILLLVHGGWSTFRESLDSRSLKSMDLYERESHLAPLNKLFVLFMYNPILIFKYAPTK